jgi:hypothetical protein
VSCSSQSSFCFVQPERGAHGAIGSQAQDEPLQCRTNQEETRGGLKISAALALRRSMESGRRQDEVAATVSAGKAGGATAAKLGQQGAGLL